MDILHIDTQGMWLDDEVQKAVHDFIYHHTTQIYKKDMKHDICVSRFLLKFMCLGKTYLM